MTSSPDSTAQSTTHPGFDEVVAAAERLRGVAIETPLLNVPALDERVGGRILIKPETLQRTGSFKFRGAYNKLSQLPETAKEGGVVAYSSGNHAQGVAHAAQLLGIPAVIVMPSDAPKMKIENTRGYGAEVQLYDRYQEQREQVGAQIAAERGATLVKPYDDPDVIAGQGTCGLEIARQAAARGWRVDALLTCCGGGGLTAGSALAMRELSPATEVYTVEPEGFDDHARSLAEGRRVSNDPSGKSFCDALLAPTPGELTFEINRKLLAGGLAVSDAEVRQAMDFAFRALKLVVEPGGAVCLAAVLAGKLDLHGRTVAITMSGGNVDPETFCEAIRGAT
ncbi:threonine ammonia-lyase [Ferruginivarius sediminum]|uniref:Threonine/serine dehydratase n=1 Tax=Ferruginivarius sediminum TaxID=2661937 RepID=A0A369TFZ2_9PROT|nr:threonine/serine dehydratase [Ferruginivarius sediminum]RDD63732.1 threonine/serine dehydratase [Ferruginivarius sediminum]